MALDTALVYRPFGAAIIQVGTGSGGALETLGYTENGVDVGERYALRPIFTDVAGPEFPGEEQKFGIGFEMTAPFIVWNPTILDKVIRKMANSSTAGVLVASGTLFHTGGSTFKVAIVSADSLEDPYYLPTCKISAPTNRKLGSAHSPLRLQFTGNAYHLATETTVANKVVFSRTLP